MADNDELCDMQVRLCEIQAKLTTLDNKIDRLIASSAPVDTHADWAEIETHRKLDVLLTVNDKMDTLLAMIAPVHAHAAWVDTLRKRLSAVGLVKDRRISNEAE